MFIFGVLSIQTMSSLAAKFRTNIQSGEQNYWEPFKLSAVQKKGKQEIKENTIFKAWWNTSSNMYENQAKRL